MSSDVVVGSSWCRDVGASAGVVELRDDEGEGFRMRKMVGRESGGRW